VLALLVAAATLGGGPRSAADGLAPDPVERLKQALDQKDSSRERRQAALRAAADQLQSIGDMSRALVLSDWKTDSNVEEAVVREAIAGRFAKKVHETAVKGNAWQQAAVANLVGETAVSVRSGFADQALRQTLSGLADDLIPLTESSDPAVRQAAARALGNIDPDPRKAVRALGKLLAAPDVASRVAAAAALGSMLVEPKSYSGELRTPSNKERPQLAPQGGDALEAAREVAPVVTGGLDGGQPVEVRRRCAEALAGVTGIINNKLLGLPTQIESLPPEGLTEDEKREGQRVAAQWDSLRALFKGFEDQSAVIARAAVDPDPAVRIQVRRVLEDLAVARRSAQRIKEKVPAPRPDTEPADQNKTPEKPVPNKKVPEKSGEPKRVEGFLPALPGAGAAPGVLVARQDDDRREQGDSLGHTLRRALDAAVAGLSDPNVRARLAAVDLLETMGPEAAPAIPALVDKLRDPDRFVRWSAVRTLGRLAPRSPDLVVPGLARTLQNPDLDVRLATAGALERYGPDAGEAVTPLGLQAMQGDPEIRIAAMRALVAIGTAAAPALPAVARNLDADNPRVRAAAADTLGRFGQLAARAEAPLRRLLDDPDSDVRRAASDALLKVTGH
jgi:HEAT repeat protein